MPVRPDVVAGYAKPKAKAKKKKAPAPGTQGPARRGASQPKGPVARPKAQPKPKVDTGNILKLATPNTVRVKPKGSKRAVTVDTGDILQGHGNVRPRQAPPAKRPSFGKALKQELEGTGSIAEAAKRAGEAIGKSAVIVSGGAGPTAATSLGRNLGGGRVSTRAGTSHTAALLAPKAVKAPKIIGRTIKDLINVPATIGPSVYVPAAAAVEAAQGRPQRAKQFISDVKRTDPLVALASGHPGKALKLANEHPGYALLEAAGTVGGLGRAAGRAVRGTGKVVRTVAPAAGEKIRRVGAVETRPNAITPHTAHEVHRAYSPDLAHKAVQVALDKRNAKKVAKLRAEADRMQHVDSHRAIELRQQAYQQDRLIASTRQIKARENLREQAGETLRKDAVHAIDVKTRKIIAAHGDKGAAPVLVTSGVTRATVADLRRYKAELEAAYQTLQDPGKRADNVALRRAIDVSIERAGKKGDPNLTDIAAAATRYHHTIDVPLDRQLNELGILPHQRGEKAKLIPMAAREVGATRQHIDPLKTAQQTAARDLRSAKRARRMAGKRATRQLEVAGVAQGRAEIRHGQAERVTAKQIDAAQRAVVMHERAARNHLAHDRPAEAGAARERAAAAQARLAELRKGIDARPVGTLRKLERARAKSLHADRVLAHANQRVVVARATHAQVKAQRRAAKGPAIVDRAGNPMSLQELQALAAERRPVPPSYISQSPKARSPAAYYRTARKEPTIDARARTEKPTIEGTFNADPEAIRARAMNAQGLASAAQNFRAGLADMGYRGADGTVKMNLNGSEADQLIANLKASEGSDWVKVEATPWAANAEHIQAMADAVNGGAELDPRELAAFHDSMRSAYDLEHRNKGNGPFALIPKSAAKQRVAFLNTLNPSGFERGARAIRSSFSRTVLTTSPGPTVGNIVEPGVRAAIQHAGPLSTYRGVRTMRALKKLDPEAHRQLRAIIGRGKITLAARRHYVDPLQYNEGTVRNIVAGWQALKGAKGGKQLTAAWDLWTKVVFEQINGRAETFFREGPMLGKVLRDSGLMDHTLMGVSSKAFAEAAQGLRATPAQVYTATKLNDAYGKYGGYGPDGKRIIGDFTPFAAWWLSAATFILKVLPRDHPAAVALGASTVRATEDWRKALGLDLFAGANRAPGWLQGTVPTGKFGRVKTTYNTPFGVASDPLATAAGLVFPQGETVLKAFEGMDWKNKKLRNADGSEYDVTQQALYAAGELLKATVPAVAIPNKVHRYVTKPGTLLNPVRIPPSNKPGAGSSGAGSSGAGGGAGSSGAGTIDLNSGGGISAGSIDLSTP